MTFLTCYGFIFLAATIIGIPAVLNRSAGSTTSPRKQ